VYCEQRWIMKNVRVNGLSQVYTHPGCCTMQLVCATGAKEANDNLGDNTQFTATFNFSADDPDLERIIHRMKHTLFC